MKKFYRVKQRAAVPVMARQPAVSYSTELFVFQQETLSQISYGRFYRNHVDNFVKSSYTTILLATKLLATEQL